MRVKKNNILNTQNENSTICVVIPIYKQYPSESEKQALVNIGKKFFKYKQIIIAPFNLSLEEYYFLNAEVIFFPEKYFKSTRTYSELLLRKQFYSKFAKYGFMVIVQPDVWIIKNDITVEIFTQYDYVGAPWYSGIKLHRLQIRGSRFIPGYDKFAKTVYVGNGGFCLRNISSCIALLNKYWLYAKHWKLNEDAFFALFGKMDKKFKIAPIAIAEQFALETQADKKIKEERIIPLGVHAWEKWYPDLLSDLERWESKRRYEK